MASTFGLLAGHTILPKPPLLEQAEQQSGGKRQKPKVNQDSRNSVSATSSRTGVLFIKADKATTGGNSLANAPRTVFGRRSRYLTAYLSNKAHISHSRHPLLLRAHLPHESRVRDAARESIHASNGKHKGRGKACNGGLQRQSASHNQQHNGSQKHSRRVCHFCT